MMKIPLSRFVSWVRSIVCGIDNNGFVCGTVTPCAWGASPSATASVNCNAIQGSLNIGGHVLLDTPGTFQVNATLLIASNTRLELGQNTTVKLAASVADNLLRNKNTTGVAGYETSGTGPVTDIHAYTTPTFCIAIDGDAYENHYHPVALTPAGLTTGALIASAMQTAIRAINTNCVGYAQATVTYTGGYYIITSGQTSAGGGPCSRVRVVSSPTTDVAAALKIGVANGAANTDGTAGDTNITIQGGTWDWNGANQGATYTSWRINTMVLQCVSNLKVIHTTIQNYVGNSMILANIQGLTIDDVNNLGALTVAGGESGGIQMDGPVVNARLTNIQGSSNDDLIALLISQGAATQFLLSQPLGDFINIVVDGVYCNGSTAALTSFRAVKITGATGYWFRTIVLQNIYGVTQSNAICVETDTNESFTGTYIEDLTIRNIKTSSIYSYPQILFQDVRQINNLIIDGATLTDANSTLLQLNSNTYATTINHMVVSNINYNSDFLSPFAATAPNMVIAVQNGITINYLKLVNINAYFYNVGGAILALNGSSYSALIYHLMLDNVTGMWPSLGTGEIIYNPMSSGQSNQLGNIYLNNVVNINGGYIYRERMMTGSAVIGTTYICANNMNGGTLSTGMFYLCGASYVKMNNLVLNGSGYIVVVAAAVNVYLSGQLDYTIQPIFTNTGGGTVYAKGPTLWCDIAQLTGREGDMVYNTNSGAGGGVGVNVYHSGAWVSVT